jgi:methylmalonyl-CoA/ethylmalonyl-CoA epimerase
MKRLSHIGIAVRDLNVSSPVFAALLGTPELNRESVEDQRVRVAFFHVEGASLELTEATTPDSPIAKFIEKRGEGVHHLSFEVDNLRAELARLKAAGVRLVDEEPRRGAGGYWIAFLHPGSTNGVLIELSERMKPAETAE